ncbi:restriction endonuclease [Roseateles noduli]|uniref:restriction endonuclease n=1 Tax=Roseateles noduli TaxID=2052484 RepID=UPI003D655DE1
MARRKKGSSVEVLLDLFALMPWWACVALAAVAYLALHAWAAQPAPAPTPAGGIEQLPAVMVGAMIMQFVVIGQYVLPVLLLAAAVMSAFRRRTRKQLLEQSAQGQDADAIHGMTWHQFELLIGEAFRQKGFTVVEIGGSGPDGGVDLVLRKPSTNGNETYLVQCKHWKAYKVGVSVVRELYGVMAARGAAGGFVVTSGAFTKEATAFAEGRHMRLIDGPKLKALLATVPAPQPTPQQAAADVTMVVCPACSNPMVLRTAKRGPNAGQAFYGCSTYPVCKWTRPA